MVNPAPRRDLFPLDTINFGLPDPDEQPITDIGIIEQLFPLPTDVSYARYRPRRKVDESHVVKPSLGRVIVHGQMQREERQPVGPAWKEHLDEEIVKNLELRNEIKKLKPLQEWMYSMIQFNWSGMVVANRGFRKTIGFLLPLIEQVRTKIPESYLMVDVVYWVEDPTPYALILTATESKAEHIVKQAKWLARGTGVHVRHADGKQKEPTEEDNDPMTAPRSDIIIGKASHVMQFLRWSRAELQFIDTVVFTECEQVGRRGDDNYSEEVENLRLQLKEHNDSYFASNGRVLPDCVLMIYNEWRGNMAENLKKFIRKDEEFSAVYQEGATIYRRGPAYKVITCNVDSDEVFKYKISYVNGLVKKVLHENRGDRRTRRKCVIVANNLTQANYIAVYLTVTLDIVFPVVTEDSDAISVESARLRVRNGETDFLVCDYTGITFIEAGYVDYIAMFSMPPIELFDRKMATIKKLSAMITHKFCYVFFDPLKDQIYAPKLALLMSVSLQRVPVSLWEVADERVTQLKAELQARDVNTTKSKSPFSSYKTANEAFVNSL